MADLELRWLSSIIHPSLKRSDPVADPGCDVLDVVWKLFELLFLQPAILPISPRDIVGHAFLDRNLGGKLLPNASNFFASLPRIPVVMPSERIRR